MKQLPQGISLSLFGTFAVAIDAQPIERFRTTRVQALLVYLLVQAGDGEHMHRRESLTELLWPGMPTKSALQNLRQTLYELRKAVNNVRADDAPPLLITNRQAISVNDEITLTIDTKQVDQLLTSHPDHWHAGLALYQGDFLAGFSLPDADPFNDWVKLKRTTYKRKILDALTSLTAMQLEAGSFEDAEACARQQLVLDPLRERAHRQLITALARSGKRSAAIHQFDVCSNLLARELSVLPSAETLSLIDAIRADNLPTQTAVEPKVSNYQLGEQIGSGNFGVVFRATQTSVGRDVAVKVIREKYANDADFIRRFETEAQTIARLEHPHIVPLYDFWREPGSAYLVMRWLRGGNLESQLNGGWQPLRANNLVQQVAQGLQAAHQRGVIHRDIKAANILLDEEGNAYLSDFGIALDQGTVELADGSTTPMLLSASSVSPEQVLNRPITQQSDIYSFGIVLYQLLTGRPPFSAQTPRQLAWLHANEPLPSIKESHPQLPAAFDEVIQIATAKEANDRFSTPLDLADAFAQALNGGTMVAAPPVSLRNDIVNPYVGLAAFGEADADLFFGRNQLIPTLSQRIHDERFLAIVGPSGSGKSSVVRAGLLPALRNGAVGDSAEWFITDMLPGNNPWRDLANALLRIAVLDQPNLFQLLQQVPHSLADTVRTLLSPEGQLLLVIDQFEELFTLSQNDETVGQFLTLLTDAVEAPDSPIRIAVTLRADFYDRPLLYEAFGNLIRQHTEAITPLATDALMAAIQEPAALTGVQIAPEAVAAMVSDVRDQPGALPLLQYALTELFERRTDDTISLADYQAIGGILGALSQRADAIYEGLDSAEKPLARQLFLRLITLGDGVEDTRRRVPQSELEQVGIGNQISAFGSARLLTFDRDPATREPTVEVAHEALLREWPRLRRWLDQSRGDLRLQRMLATAAEEWIAADHDPTWLLQGSRLDQFDDWDDGTASIILTEDERALLSTSLAARNEQLAAEEERRLRELEQAQLLAETERSRAEEQTVAAGRLRQRAWLLGAAALATAILAVFAFSLRNRAQANFESAEKLRLASQARDLLLQGEDVVTSALLALHSLDYGYSLEADSALVNAVSRGFAHRELVGHRDSLATVTFSNNGRHLLTGSNDQTARLWDVETGQELRQLSGHREVVSAVSFTLDDRFILTGSADRSVRIWNAATGEQINQLPEHNVAVWSLAVSPDGTTILTNDTDDNGNHIIRIWDWETLTETGRLNGHGDTILQARFSEDGQRIVTASLDRTARVWATGTGEQLVVLEGHAGPVASVDLSPDGSEVVTGSYDNTARIWDAESGIELMRLIGHTNILSQAIWSPDGSTVMTGSEDRTTRVWNPQTGLELVRYNSAVGIGVLPQSPDGKLIITQPLDGIARLWRTDAQVEPLKLERPFRTMHAADIVRLNFAPDGDTLITSNGDGTMHEWNTEGGALFSQSGYPVGGFITNLLHSPDQRLAVTTAGDGSIVVWDAVSRTPLREMAGHLDSIWDVSFSADSATLYTAGEDGTVRIWDVAAGQQVGLLNPSSRSILSISLSPDGNRIAVAGLDDVVQIWNLATGQVETRLVGHVGAINDVLFAPSADYLLTGGDDNSARLWDAASGEEIQQYQGHSGRVNVVAFSPDERLVLTGADDFTARLWERDSAELVRHFQHDDSPLQTLAFSADGSRIATGDLRFGYLWRTDLDDVIQLVCDQLPRDFNQQERTSFNLSASANSPCEMAPVGS